MWQVVVKYKLGIKYIYNDHSIEYIINNKWIGKLDAQDIIPEMSLLYPNFEKYKYIAFKRVKDYFNNLLEEVKYEENNINCNELIMYKPNNFLCKR